MKKQETREQRIARVLHPVHTLRYAHQIANHLIGGTATAVTKKSQLGSPLAVRLILSDKSLLMLQFDSKTGELLDKSPYTGV